MRRPENRTAAAVSSVAAITPCGACPVRGLAVCGVLDPDELYALAEIVHEMHRAHRQSVIVEGDSADHFYIVTGGVASVEKLLADGRRQVVGFLYPSDFFGLATDGCYAYNVTAVTNLMFCQFDRQQYLSLIDRFPKLETRLLGLASNELAASQEQMLVLGCKTAKEKVAIIDWKFCRVYDPISTGTTRCSPILRSSSTVPATSIACGARPRHSVSTRSSG